jgi:hypothetical protein
VIATVLITVGTDDVWAPPRLVRLGIDDDLVISNLDPVDWDISDRGTITRGAIWCRGEWCGVDITPTKVGRGQTASLAAGALKIVTNLIPLDVEQRALSGQRAIGNGASRALPPG